MTKTKEMMEAEELKKRIDEAKILCFNYMIHVSGMKPDDLKNSGHKSIEAGIVWAFQHYHKRIVKMSDEFLKKYPD